MIYRQGDVLLKKVLKVPKDLQERKDKTLALGEITGHHHTLKKGKVYGVQGQQQYCVLEQETVLEHQDHEDLLIPQGMYEVVIQREFTPIDGVRQVMD